MHDGRGAPATSRLLRFDMAQRIAHWANAALFGVLVLTALPLYFPSVERVVGRHVLVATVHVWAGIALPLPLLVSLVGPWGARMRRDVRRFNRWTRAELEWLRRLGGGDRRKLDKFNPGQKLNAIFVGGSIVVFLASGVVLKWFGLFPVGWRTGATFVHEVLAYLFVAVVLGHVVMALTHRDALRSMARGWVTVTWARRNAPRWAREELGAERADEPQMVAQDPVRVPD
ncbi:MAG TPA: cytochrome b/b6 domain-containing protein [Acidimicrobiales bacterium]|nr:cytochrome b/b6 domain-containing protein [Acidimicrobiales bacterium]